MKHRATVNREGPRQAAPGEAADRSGYAIADNGHRITETATLHQALPCYFWVDSGEIVIDEDKTTKIIDYRAMIPWESDVVALDTVEQIVDRRGRSLLLGAGRMRVLAVLPYHADHLLLNLERIG